MRYRITVRGESLELRGYADGEAVVRTLADDVAPDIVVASPAADDWNPWPISEPDNPPTIETSYEIVRDISVNLTAEDALERLAGMHYMQAMVIRGERGRAEQAERELTERELHHFETEVENTRLAQVVEDICAVQGHKWKRKMHGKVCQRCETFEAD